MSDQAFKSISIKFIGSPRSAETVSIMPGSTVREILQAVGLDATGFQLVDPHKPEAIFNPTDVLYARVNDGDLLAATALVDAGLEAAA
ncbi:MAG: hypothetical protein APF80_17430 [Alphaproteobacteria bacterium BRH_c36]|nr:MAG: hypothetical protein APF80_17430 [Alphaproteobacteria bacterium BRH_c36]